MTRAAIPRPDRHISDNPLSIYALPADPHERALEIAHLVDILLPGPATGADFFTYKGRNALRALATYIVHKINILADYDEIPSEYIDHEASYPLMTAWFARAQRLHAEDPLYPASSKPLLRAIAMSISQHNATTDNPALKYPAPVLQEFLELVNTDERVRYSILSTALAGITR